MMKKWLAVFTAAAGITLAGGSAEPQLLGGFMKLKPSGEFTVDNASFHLTHFGVNWAITVQDSGCVVPAKGFPAVSADSFRLEGEYKATNGLFKLEEIVTSPGADRAELQLRLNSSAPVFTSDLALEVKLPCERYYDLPILADGKEINFPEKFRDDLSSRELRVKSLELPLDRGTLTISGDFAIRFQDNRL